MDISLGFIILLTLVLFPGLIFRRFFYYGEFSKHFSAGRNLIRLIFISSIPGVILLFLSALMYSKFFSDIDAGLVIDYIKDVRDSDFRYQQTDAEPISKTFLSKAVPFMAFLYTISLVSGAAAGRLIRVTALDTKLKILRFKNYWFYLINGHYTKFKEKKKALPDDGGEASGAGRRKRLFTRADVLVKSETENILYSGIIVDYELSEDDCTSLSKLILRNMKKTANNSIEPTQKIERIPGNLFVIDSQQIHTINFTYIFEQHRDFLQTKWPEIISVSFALIVIFLFPVIMFEINIYDSFYTYIEPLNILEKLLLYVFTVQLIGLALPIIRVNGSYRWVRMRSFLAKVLVTVILGALVYYLLM